ncbi:MAG TPA: hypothetical protein VD948_01450, partial [Rhodothermales bacterium]|nr:hypothetical protein [Rhodothermales bacterium]
MQSARPFLALAILALLVSTHVSGAQENPTDPAAILRRAADALRQVQAVTYTAEHTIRAEGTWPSVRGQVTVARARTDDDALFRHQHFVLDAQVRMLDGHVDSVFATYDGTRLLLRDDTAKVVYEAATPFAAGQLLSEASPILSVASIFTTPAPFERDLTRPLRYVGREVVAGVPVHVVEVQIESPMPDGRARQSLSTWYLGEQDYLPRRHRFNSLEATITALTVNPPVTAETFRMRAPDTYPYQRVTQRQPRTAGQGV